MIAALLRLEAPLALLLAWLLVFGLPLRRLERLFGRMAAPVANSSHTSPADTPPFDIVPVAVLRRARAVAQRLARRGIRGGTIRFGVRKRDGALQAHAWLLLGPDILLGGEEAGAYVPLADLAALAGDSGRGRGGHNGMGGR